MLKKAFFYLLALSFIYSCAPINPSIMLKTPKDYEFDTYKKDSLVDYRIAINDRIQFQMYTNNGYKLIDLTSLNSNNAAQVNVNNLGNLEFLVEFDGYINLPIIGRVKVDSMTIREAEFHLEELYSELYIDPYILLRVTNQRVTIFPGNGGNGQVITLQNNNTSLIEALALAGGLTETGKAKRIKLIRGNLQDPEVYLIDLSTIDGLAKADIILQANDIIYVEPINATARRFVTEIAPVLSFITSLVTLYLVTDRLGN